jgi:hypothetical protein
LIKAALRTNITVPRELPDSTRLAVYILTTDGKTLGNGDVGPSATISANQSALLLLKFPIIPLVSIVGISTIGMFLQVDGTVPAWIQIT